MQIRNRVISPKYGIWILAEDFGSWSLWHTNPQSFVATVRDYEPFWAMKSHQDPSEADFESYGGASIVGWKIIKETRVCHRCLAPFETEPNSERCFCEACGKAFRAADENGDLIEDRPEIKNRAKARDRAERRDYANRRWLREFVAAGRHTTAEFRELCDRYGNVCLCCREERPLVEDHVIPLDRGGTDYIENIQPLCRSCNSSKGTDSTDYRPDPRAVQIIK